MPFHIKCIPYTERLLVEVKTPISGGIPPSTIRSPTLPAKPQRLYLPLPRQTALWPASSSGLYRLFEVDFLLVASS